MTKPINTQSEKRSLESLGSLFDGTVSGEKNYLFLKSSSDEGVIRNGGRNGARFAPQSLLATFKKLNKSQEHSKFSFGEFEVASAAEEKENFNEAQILQSDRIRSLIGNTTSTVCHIGGGHDHVYPLLRALRSTFKKFVVVNVDAHADTRVDQAPHSGTPFRQFAREVDDSFRLFQIGLHPYANSLSTLSELENGSMSILWKNEIAQKRELFFKQIAREISEDTVVIFSIDADALSASQVPGVSALNADGISVETLTLLYREYLNLGQRHAPVIGIYELNPVYDSLGSLSMRTLSSFLFQTLV